MMALPEIWQMWSVFGIVAVGVFFYVRETFTIETISVGIILALMVFFHISAMASRLRHRASRYMMPLSFVSILAGMTTLIGSSTNLLVNDVLIRTTDFELSFFSQFVPGITLAIIGAAYIIIMAPILLPEREGLETEMNATGHQYIAQIRVTPNIAPGSRMIGRTIEQVGFRRQTGTLVLGVQRRSRMIRKRMLEIRLEAGDVLLLFGYDSDMLGLRNNRDLLLLDWSMVELPDIRKSLIARMIFIATIAIAALSILPIEIAALGGALGMIATGCLNIRQAVRALDMRIFLLIGAAFAMGLSLEQTGGAAYIGEGIVTAFMPYGNQILIGAVFLVIAFFTNIISNSAAALLFSPIALEISAQTGIDPIAMVLTVIFAANCCFATPIVQL